MQQRREWSRNAPDQVHDLAARITEGAGWVLSWTGRLRERLGQATPTTTLLANMERATSYLGLAVRAIQGADTTSARTSESDLVGGTGDGLSGSARAIPLEELLSFLSFAGKSGVLRVHLAEERLTIQIQAGVVVFAETDRPPPGQALGEILVERGCLCPKRFVQLPTRDLRSESFSNAVQRAGWVGQAELAAVTDELARGILFRMLAAQEAHFWYHEGARVRKPARLELLVPPLLLEFAHRTDENDRAHLRAQARRARRRLAAA